MSLICTTKPAIISYDIDIFRVQRQAIIWTGADLLLIW